MSFAKARLALYTTMYPAVQPYLRAFSDSILAQQDRDFDLWVGLDTLTPAQAQAAAQTPLHARFIESLPGESPVALRCRALRGVIEEHGAVVLVDADDILCADRVAAARVQLESADATVCAQHLIDQSGDDLRVLFTLPAQDWEAALVRTNCFGFSNTAYRSATLALGLDVPDTCVAMDWYVATRAWLAGARFHFDRGARMRYRQHRRNVAAIARPFTPAQVLAGTEIVTRHLQAVIPHARRADPEKARLLGERLARVEAFALRASAGAEWLTAYCEALNRLPESHLWWSMVAHPQLEEETQRLGRSPEDPT